MNLKVFVSIITLIFLFCSPLVFGQGIKYCIFEGQTTKIISTQLDEQIFPRGSRLFASDDCNYGVRVLSVSSDSATVELYYNDGESEQLTLAVKEPKKLSDNTNYIILLGAYPSTNEASISLTNLEDPDLCHGGTCPSCEGQGVEYSCYKNDCPTTGYELISHLPCDIGVCCKKTTGVTTENIYTNKELYSEGDYINVFVELPYIVDSCEMYLTSPEGDETLKGIGGCGPFDAYNPPRISEHRIVDRIDYTEFSSSAYLGENYGKWGIKVLVKKDEDVVKTLTTDFEYNYYNNIVEYCTLRDTKTKNCEFLGSTFEVTRNGGCGPYPVNIKIKYFGGEKSMRIAQGETDMLTVGLIVVRNMGSPCTVDVLNLRFDKLITIEDTSLRISSEEKTMESEIDGETEVYSLPTEERTTVFEAKVNEGTTLKKMSIEIDNVKDVLVIESNEVEAETELDLSIEGSQLYVEFEGQKVEVNILPDKALEKVETKIDSVENIEIESEDISYSIKGSKNVKVLGFIPTKMNVEVKIDIESGEVNKIRKPWWSFLAV